MLWICFFLKFPFQCMFSFRLKKDKNAAPSSCAVGVHPEVKGPSERGRGRAGEGSYMIFPALPPSCSLSADLADTVLDTGPGKKQAFGRCLLIK